MRSIPLLALCLAACVPSSGPRPAAAPDPVDALAAVLVDVRARVSLPDSIPLMLSEMMLWEAPYVHPTPGDHPPEVLARLRALPVVQLLCGEPFCPTPERAIRVRIGGVRALPPGTRVRILGEHPGVPLNEELEAIPESLAVPADAWVEVRVDDVSYRYYLEVVRGKYSVLTRYMVGAI